MNKPFIVVPKGLLPDVYLDGYSASGAIAKAAFHRDGEAFLKKIASALGLSAADFHLSSNKAGIAVSGEVVLHSEDLYLELQDFSGPGPGVSLLYRSCKSRKDCAGHRNHHVMLEALTEEWRQESLLDDLAALLRGERERKAATRAVAA